MGNKLSRKKTKEKSSSTTKGNVTTVKKNTEVEEVESTGCFSCFGFFKRGAKVEVEVEETRRAKFSFSCCVSADD